MLLSTRNSAKQAAKQVGETDDKMAANDLAKLNVTPVGKKRKMSAIKQRKSPAKAAMHGGKAKAGKIVTAHFSEDNDEVSFEVEAPKGFLSEGKVQGSSDSEHDSEDALSVTPDQSEDEMSQQGRGHRSRSLTRSRSQSG